MRDHFPARGLYGTNGYTWGKRNCRAYAGSFSGWGVGGGTNGAAKSCGTNYPDSTDSWMAYGPFSLVGATAADLKFQLWLNTESSYDMVCGLAATNASSPANFNGTCTSGNSGGWIDRTLDLSNVYGLGNLLGQSQVWIALEFYSDSTINYSEGGHVDNIVLRKCVAGATCPVSASSPASANDQTSEIPSQVIKRSK